jgi:hypothetical protein
MAGTRKVGEISKACREVPEACRELVKMMLGKVVAESDVPSRTDRYVWGRRVRWGDGIFGMLSLRANMPMMRMESSLVGGLISGTREKKLADENIPRMSIGVRDRDQKAAYLSGGNQQKRVMRCSPHDAPGKS